MGFKSRYNNLNIELFQELNCHSPIMSEDKLLHVKVIAPTSVVVTLIAGLILVRVFMCLKRITSVSDLLAYAKTQKNEVYYIYVYVSSRVTNSGVYEERENTSEVNSEVNRSRQGLAMVFMFG